MPISTHLCNLPCKSGFCETHSLNQLVHRKTLKPNLEAISGAIKDSQAELSTLKHNIWIIIAKCMWLWGDFDCSHGDIGAVSDQCLDPLSRIIPGSSSNKSPSLVTPLADPCCWGQLQESGLSGPTPTWPGSAKTRRRSTWFKLLPKMCWQG